MENNDILKTNGTKAFAGVLIIIAMIGATAAIVKPIQQQIEAVSERISQHISQNNHPWGVIAEIAEIKQKFIEVETQFNGLRNVIQTEDIRNRTRITNLERLGIKYTEESLATIAILEEKIKQLEKKIND